MNDQITTRERWLAALAYLSVLVFIPIISRRKSDFLVRHCQQGFALLFVEVVGYAFILIIDATLGLVPVLGFLLAIVLRLVFFLVFLILSVLGFIRAMFGERWRIPFLDEIADRVPVD